MSQNKNDETFRVIDRRLFTSEGELRPEAIDQEKAEKTSSAVKPSGNPAAAGARPAGSSTVAAPVPDTPAVASEPARVSPSFQKLIDFLAQNAVVCLGVPDPRTGQAFLDLETARELIDMLEALREKTTGNLAPEDDRLLAEVLGQLQLTFLDRSQAVAKAQREKAGLGKP
ncbi:MAG: DUF1844 domain-containing protein [Acidobacteria bacterium]|nr:DUF1844 domain-containing protein [Acidobacteriota bacterium]MBI3664179.1 DUF1844 domain-containing protein [Acidobacteriota bacterium]